MVRGSRHRQTESSCSARSPPRSPSCSEVDSLSRHCCHPCSRSHRYLRLIHWLPCFTVCISLEPLFDIFILTLIFLLSQLNMEKVQFDTQNHGRQGGDNFGEGNLDTSMISSFGLNATTIVSNTNVSSSTEEGKGFGDALLIFLTDLASRKELPQVLSLSLGSLSAASCDLLRTEAVKKGVSAEKCNEFLQSQRQVLHV